MKLNKRKKVLITGMTHVQVNASRRSDYLTPVPLYNEMLKVLGYDVYWGTLNDCNIKLEDYDLVLCGLLHWRSRISGFAYNMLLASQHKNTVFFVDDWQLQGIQMTDKILDNLFDDFMMETNRAIGELTKAIKNKIQKAAESFKLNKINLMVPTFNYGNPSLLVSKLERPEQYILYPIDPSPFVDLKQSTNDKKLKRWVSASLKDISNSSYIKKLKLTWPIEYYHKKNPVSEHYLIDNVYPNNWGIVAQKYYHVGSGWWRPRYLHAIRSNSIMLACSEEVVYIGDAYMIRQDIIEQMSNKKLNCLAQQQREQFLSHQLSKEATLEKFNKIININK